MKEERELSPSLALEAVLSAACALHVQVDELCEKAIESLLTLLSSASSFVAQAIDEKENSADSLDYDADVG